MIEDDFEVPIKGVIVGNGAVGKSSMIQVFTLHFIQVRFYFVISELWLMLIILRYSNCSTHTNALSLSEIL